jgi:hypothetical protein
MVILTKKDLDNFVFTGNSQIPIMVSTQNKHFIFTDCRRVIECFQLVKFFFHCSGRKQSRMSHSERERRRITVLGKFHIGKPAVGLELFCNLFE